MQKISILGVNINNVTFDQTIRVINNFIVLGKPKQIVTVNPEFIMEAQKNEEFRNVLNCADLSVPDGAGLILISKLLAKSSHKLSSPHPISPLKERVTGTDLVIELAKLSAKKNYPVFLLGAAPGVAEKTATVLKEKFPGTNICGSYAGRPVLRHEKIHSYKELRMTDVKQRAVDPNFEIIKRIKQAKPKILLVAYGAPKQDLFIARYKNVLNIPVMMGVGGAYDFISGGAKRAPKWMRDIGLEWLWRLFTQPRRLNRILTALFRFPWAVIKNRYFRR